MKKPELYGLAFCLLALAAGCAHQIETPRVRLEMVLQAVGDSVDASSPYIAISAPHHGIYISTQAVSGLVEEIDSTGHLKRTFGQAGQGPGEYERASLILASPDKIIIGDFLGRFHVFSGEGSFVSTILGTVNGVTTGLLLRGDTMVIMQRVSDVERFGLPLHLIAPDGHIVKSFGADDRSSSPQHMLRFLRTLAPDTDSSFWVARMDEYTIELWTTSGKMLRRIHQIRDWFPEITVDPAPIDRERPATVLLRVHRDLDGHLLVLLRRARPDWKPRIAPLHWPTVPSEAMRYIEEVLEVIDLSSGQQIASVVNRRSAILGFLSDGRLYGTVEDSVGRQMPALWKLDH